MDVSTLALAALLALACVAATGFALRERRTRRVVDALRLQLDSSPAASRKDFFATFSTELPHLTRELHGQSEARAIPTALLQILMRTFRPSQALVALRRHGVTSDPSRGRTLTIAEVSGSGTTARRGTELRLGEGPIGFVAEVRQLLCRDELDDVPPQVRSVLEGGPPEGLDWFLAVPMVWNGETLGVLTISRPELDVETAKAGLRLIAHVGAMALQHATAYGQMKVSAELDGLTGLYNKTHILSTLGDCIRKCDADGTQLSILLLDIDHFKNYNDANGHDDGDRLLEEFAQVLSDNIRSSCVLGRYGGEEFLLILPGTSGENALKAADSVRKTVSAHPFAHREKQPLGILSFSGGVASYPENALGSNELIRAADRALYASKRAGRNQVLRTAAVPLDDDECGKTLELERLTLPASTG